MLGESITVTVLLLGRPGKVAVPKALPGGGSVFLGSSGIWIWPKLVHGKLEAGQDPLSPKLG